ncbi:MAG: C10 family peptidase [Bacteroidales bacterium]|nr:C10 family peptidase [Bacteroidales bacterium]
MRKVLLIIATLFIACGVQAKKIKVQDAELIARQFVAGNSARPLDLAYTFSTGDKPDLYIFNKSSMDGFVVIAADDVADNLVLGYSDRSLFDKDDIPENLRWWLGEYQKEINYARSIGHKSSRKSAGNVRKSAGDVVVAPLLGSLAWDQGAPYNRLCPKEGKASCFTGCVATAMAQIMYYNKWPLRGKGQHSYKWKTETLSVDFSQSVYDYSKMKLTYDSYTEEQADAVARLMYDCGVSVDMQYGSNGSGAYSEDVPKALKTYFDYDVSVKYYDRMDYKNKDDEWDGMIRAELDAHRPVYYSGTDPKEGGHAFVCDGYKDNGFFHFNFGWSGSGNGYFISKVLATSVGNFAANQDIVIGIKANNKQKAGNLYYSVIGENNVAVQAPGTPSEYSGDVTIPASVSIDGKTYQVTEVAAYAFYGSDISSIRIPSSVNIVGPGAIASCKNLKTVVVEWTSWDNVDVAVDAFGDETYSNATLTVPAGTFETYGNAAPWWFFNTMKDTNGKSVTYSSWKPFCTGTGTYYYSAALSDEDPGLSIQYRENTADPDQQQIIIANWGGGVNLMIKYDKATDRYVVPRQNSKISSSVGDVYVADMPTAHPDQYTYETCPNTYDAKKGQLYIYMTYMTFDNRTFGSGLELFQLDGYPDYSLSVDATTLTEQSDGSAFQLTSFEWGEGIKTVKYALIPENLMFEDEVEEYIALMLDGTIETKTVSERMKNRTVITLPHEGKYTIIAIGFDKDGEYTSYDFCNVIFASSSSWVAIGQATYTDDIIGPLFGMDPVTYKVDMEASTVTPGVYKMKYPYGPTYPYNEDGDYAAGKTYDIVINASDPDCVYIEEQKTGCDWGYGNMIIMSMGYYDVAYQGYDWAQVKAEGQGGQLKYNIIKFPKNGIVTVLGDGAYYGNTNGKFALDLTGTHIPDAIEDNLATRTATAVTHNLAGQQVGADYKGIVIQNGKKMLKR